MSEVLQTVPSFSSVFLQGGDKKMYTREGVKTFIDGGGVDNDFDEEMDVSGASKLSVEARVP